MWKQNPKKKKMKTLNLFWWAVIINFRPSRHRKSQISGSAAAVESGGGWRRGIWRNDVGEGDEIGVGGNDVVGGGGGGCGRGWGSEADVFGEVEFGLVASESEGGLVVGSGGGFRRVESAEPNSDGLKWVPNLRRPFSPRPLPHSSVSPHRRHSIIIIPACFSVVLVNHRRAGLAAGRRISPTLYNTIQYNQSNILENLPLLIRLVINVLFFSRFKVVQHVEVEV